jgi:2-polyprenyl-6-methoxyphenol hydroxylase-like FAD-dependent oxidoreductase
MAHAFDICIRGAGIVGRTLALHLAALRLRVALVDSAATNSTSVDDVRAYALNQASRTLLEAVHCWPDVQHATPMLHMQVATEQAQLTFTAQEQHTTALGWIVDVPFLEQSLANAVRQQPRITVVESPTTALLTAICEGRHSSTRHEWGMEWETIQYGQSALAARVHCSRPHQQTARQWMRQGEILALLPIGGSTGRDYALVWSASPERALQLLQSTEADFCAELTQASLQDATLTLTSQRKIWPLQHAQARRWSGRHAEGAWVVAGDAAHQVHPLAGQGLNLGLADVAELTHILLHRPYWRSIADMQLLRQYERRRKAAFAVAGTSNDTLQQLFTHPQPWLQMVRDWGMNRFNQLPYLKHLAAQRAMGISVK